MLIVQIDKPEFQYDIHSLVKAFYPDQDISVLTAEELPGMGERREDVLFSLNTDGGAGDAELPQDRIGRKNRLKRQIYERLSEETGRELPWGTLTGIRPTKLIMDMLEKGAGDGEIRTHMRQTYLIGEEKLSLSLEIAKREREITGCLHGADGFSMYIGIPFCPSKCLYCSFTSYPIDRWRDRVGEYLDALEREMILTAEAYRGKILDTVYIGGGTPTTLMPDELRRLLDMVERHFDTGSLCEWTVEAGRPDSISTEKLAALRDYGVARISVNPQTMKDETLALIGRKHTAAQTRDAFYLARDMGFDNINMDLILGLPGEGAADVEETMRQAGELDPDSLTVHSLAVKRASGLADWMREHPEHAVVNDGGIMEITERAARDMGMAPYYLYRQKNMAGNFENTGYAKPGKYGLYNIITMQEKQDVAALGAGAISKRVYPDGRIERTDNYKELTLYLNDIDKVLEKKRRFYFPEGKS